MSSSVTYGDHLIEFEYLVKPDIKNCYITVSPDKGVTVKAPTDSLDYVKDFVLRKAKWILKKQKEQIQALSSEIQFETGARIPYLGKQYYLTVTKDSQLESPEICFQQSKFEVEYNPTLHTKDDLYQALGAFYLEKAIEKIPSKVRHWSKQSLLKPNSVRFKTMKTRWASCGSNNDISFSPELMKLPISLIDYVIAHELAHVAHKNHSKEFWQLVRKLMPDYQTRHQQMNMKAF